MAIDTIGANALASNSVTTAKIAADAVTSAKIPAGAVVASDVADGSVTTAKLADNAVTSAKALNLGRRNLLINGGMQVSQRGTSFSSMSASAYTCDRWQLQLAGAGRPTVTQQTSGGPAGFKDNFLRVQVATADSSVASSDMQVLKQVIEGHQAAFTDAGTSDAQPLTLSFYVRSSVTGTFTATLYINFNNPSAVSYPAEYTISSANTWELKTITFPAFTTSSTMATVGYTTGEFYQVRFALMAGSDKTGTPNQWNSANDFASTNQTNLFATSNATWDITGVQLEVGSAATNFEHRSFAEELRDCQRYYFHTYRQGIAIGSTGSDNGAALSRIYSAVTNHHNFTVIYPQHMRATPSITYYSINGTVDRVSFLGSDYSHDTNVSITATYELGERGINGISIGAGDQSIGGHVIANAEL